MKKIILFSSKGYVGSLLKQHILKERDVRLFEMTRNSKLIDYDDDYDVLIYSASVSRAGVVKYIEDNVLTAVTMMDFCKEHHVKRIIYLSSDSIYGELNTDEVSENTVMVNPDFYGTTKYLAERIIMESGIPYYILRLPGIVGKIWGNTYLHRLMDKLCRHELITVYNGDRKFNNVLEIDDLMHFITHLCNVQSDCNEIFLLGNTQKIKLMKIIHYTKELCGSSSQIDFVSATGKRYFTLDVNKAVEYGYSSKAMWDILNMLYRERQK